MYIPFIRNINNKIVKIKEADPPQKVLNIYYFFHINVIG